MKLWDYIKRRMFFYPNQKICEGDSELTYEETIIWAEQFSQKLEGIECCAILCQSEMAAAMALLACFAAEVTAVPLSLRYGDAHCSKILDTINPDAIILDDGDINIYRITSSQYILPDEHPALIMCTSGTTGKPKGVMLSEKNIIANVMDISSYFAISAKDTILISRPLYHCAVLTGEFLTALFKGSKIVFYSEKFNPSVLLDLIDKYNITAFCSTPTQLNILTIFNRSSKANKLKHICISGECMGANTGLHIANSFPESKIYHIYGLTEACPRVSYLPPSLFRKHPDCVGIPLNSVSIKIINKKGHECKTNEEGVLWVSGDNIMIGYYQDPQATSKVMRGRWLCTGDIAIINDAGLLQIKGRIDNMIIKSGMNIYPAEIEEILKKDERVKEVMAYGINSSYGTQIGIKIVGDFSSTEEVKQFCIDVLPTFQVPTNIEIVAELPKNGSGKIIRKPS